MLFRFRLIFFADEVERPSRASGLVGLASLPADFEDPALGQVVEHSFDRRQREARLLRHLLGLGGAALDNLDDPGLFGGEGEEQVAELRLLFADEAVDLCEYPAGLRALPREAQRPVKLLPGLRGKPVDLHVSHTAKTGSHWVLLAPFPLRNGFKFLPGRLLLRLRLLLRPGRD